MSSIKDRLDAIRQQAKKSAPSFAPTPRAPKPKEILPDISEFVVASELHDVQELVRLHARYGAEERIAKKSKKPIAEALKTACNDYGITKVVSEGNRVTYYPTSRPSISAQLLIEQGVSLEVIRKSTVPNAGWAIRVSPIGENDGDDED